MSGVPGGPAGTGLGLPVSNSMSYSGTPIRLSSAETHNTVGLGGLGTVTSASNITSQAHNPISMNYGTTSAQLSPMVPSKGQPSQSHFLAVANRARMQQPIPKEDIKMESDEQLMDTSGTVSGLVMGSDGGSGGDPNSSAGTQSEQRLKVEDALNYLDQVKYKFGNQPQVYNDFLDIMKEFKSQSIDTPGVIARVSQLFRGHPELIVGFNTFLPPGYKIEIQANDSVSLSMIGQGGGYVVTTVQTSLAGPGGHPSSQSTIIHQHTNIPPAPVRPPLANVNTNSGRMSPQPSALTGSASNNNASSAFTHSFTSPFVQSAFPSLQSQPVEFNHAINYVNKIKNRFQGQPDKYKQFLEILHTYQKEQRNIKDGHPPSNKHLTEHEVYSQVAKLFENQEDLLQEFGQFLPDATNHQNTSAIDQAKKSVKMNRDYVTVQSKAIPPMSHKRPSVQSSSQDRKKQKQIVSFQYPRQDISLVEAGRYGTLNDFAFFDKVRLLLKTPGVYKNFLRCLQLYSDELLALNELLLLVNPFLAKSPELHNWFKDFVGVKHEGPSSYYDSHANSLSSKPTDKLTEEQMVEIDFSSCKRLGASYCAMPKNNMPPKCSGRSLLPLCKEVLNDVWVSFPAWSEDTAFSSSRKTTFEECIYRVEDERFELDVVIETNTTVIRSFESLAKKMTRMTAEELSEFELDECLGGTSPTIHQRAIRRIYGEKAPEIIDGLKKQPQMALPLVIRRLKAKDEEWREAQKQFNKTWREQTEKFYLKSLDLQGIPFKQTDIKALRSKSLINEIETLFDERQEQLVSNSALQNSPHLTLLYRDRTILDDACLLLLHHVRRQSSIHKDDKRKIKQLLKHFLADLFHHTRMELSDDEDEGSPDEHDGRRSPNEPAGNGTRKRNTNGKRGNGGSKIVTIKKEVEEETINISASKESSDTFVATSSTASIWSELTKQKKLSTAQESQESRRTIAKRELKLLLSDARAHELTEVGRTSLRDKVNREYLSEMSKDDTLSGPNSIPPPSSAKRRITRRSLSQQGGDSSASQTAEPTTGTPQQRIITIPNPDEDEAYSLFYANSSWYVFLRLHQILCERLSKIYEKAANLLMEETNEQKKSATNMLKMRSKNEGEVANYYPHFLEMIRNLLDGNMEPSAYEDTLREMFGIHAYIAYTMDKVVSNAVRQLQGIMSDETSQKCLEIFHQAGKRNGNGGFLINMSQRASPEIWYHKQAEKVCGEETCVKTMIFKKHCRMTMELLECDSPSDADIDQKAKFSAYVAKFLKPDSTIPESIMAVLGANPVFLARNVQKWKKKNLLEWISSNAKKGNDFGKNIRIKQEKMDFDESSSSDYGLPSTKKIMLTELDIEIKTEPGEDEDIVFTSEKIVKPIDIGNSSNNDEKPMSSKDEPESDLEKHLVIKSLEKSQNEQRTVQFLMQENLQCQFNLSSYRMVYLTNSEDCIYLKGAMQRARKTHKKLSVKLSNQFQKWHERWLAEFVTDSLSSNCVDFLMDKGSIYRRKTTRTLISRTDKPPYRSFYKYTVLGVVESM